LYYYNIHDIVRIQSEVLLYELEYFASESFDSPDLAVKVSSSIPGGIALTRNITKPKPWDPSYITYSEHFGSLGAKFSMEFSDVIVITVNKMISRSKHVLYVNLVEPILRFMMISRNHVLLHSACVDLEGHGLLLSAPPDTGKTTTVLKCIKKGYAFLSDDMTIIRLPNEALCFPKPMTISAHTFQTAVNVSDGHSNTGGMRIRSLVHSKGGRSFMHHLAEYNVPIFTLNAIGQIIVKPPKFNVQRLLNSVNIKRSAKVESLYFLERQGNECIILDTETALSTALENSDDAFLFPPYKDLLEYIMIKGKSAHALLSEERRILEKFFSEISCFTLKSDTRSWYNMVTSYTESKIR
jgi:dolichol-phosphate mannosyltransferase